jgi:hypothetical protein
MKAILLRSAALICLLTVAAHSRTINWGSEVFSILVDSSNQELTLSSNTPVDNFVFELGAFRTVTNTEFVPTLFNIEQWATNWKVFDRASYSQTSDYFTSTVEINSSGFSSNTAVAPSNFNFDNLPAYIWIRNEGVTAGSTAAEWLLVRSSSWTFDAPLSHCCDPNLPVEWSVSDLTAADIPVYGAQKDDTRAYENGVISSQPVAQVGPYLQTATFAFSPVPELSSSVLILVLGVLGLLDRRRAWSINSSARQPL